MGVWSPRIEWPEPESAWSIVHIIRGKRYMATDTIRRTRRESILVYADVYETREIGQRRFRQLRRQGRIECVRVFIREAGE